MMRALLLLWGMAGLLRAAEPAVGGVVTELLKPEGVILVGQPLTLVVTLRSPTHFSGTPDFQVPQVPGVLVAPAGGHPVVGSDTVDGAQVMTQRWELTVIGRRAGTAEIPAFPVSYLIAGAIGAPPVPVRGTTAAVSFSTAPIPGADGLRDVVFASGMTVEESWKPEPARARQGAAFTRTIVRTVAGLPAQLLPPLDLGDAEGVRAYPKPPTVEDRADRGTSRGTRTDSAAYVCERPGEAVIPGLTVAWYDQATGRVERRELPERRFTIDPDPALAPKPAAPAPVPTHQGLIALIAAAPLLIAGILLVRRRRRVPDAEARSFARVAAACTAGDEAAAHAALEAWFAQIPGGRPVCGGDALAALLARLDKRRFARDPGPPVPMDDLLIRLRALRRDRGIRVRTDPPTPLAPLGCAS